MTQGRDYNNVATEARSPNRETRNYLLVAHRMIQRPISKIATRRLYNIYYEDCQGKKEFGSELFGRACHPSGVLLIILDNFPGFRSPETPCFNVRSASLRASLRR